MSKAIPVRPATQNTVPVAVSIMNESTDSRIKLESFIHDVYQGIYGADVKSFMPVLMGLTNTVGEYQASLGFRFAKDTSLFLEQYLDASVEEKISHATHYVHDEISRDNIVEVGNLAANHAGGTRSLIIALTAYLQGAGYDWVVFTSVPSLRNSFKKLGLKLYTLGEAKLSALPPEQQSDWGSYYDSRPLVIAVNVHHTYGVLEKLLRLEQALMVFQQLWQQSFASGNAAFIQESAVLQQTTGR